MKAFYCDHFVLPLPAGHRFPMAKYRLLRERVTAEGIVAPHDLGVPGPAPDEVLLQAHEAVYLEQVKTGTLAAPHVRRIGFPWSPAMVERSRRSVGGTVAACRVALEEGVAANLAGGTHHAFAGRGEGFCVFNDAAVAVRALQEEGRIEHALVVDCDVHQGNGTASIFRDDPTVFTLSLHGRKNFPFHKERSDLDLPLEDGTADEAYLDVLAEGLEQSFGRARPDLVVYLAGADPFAGDRLGRLALTKEGLRRRDEAVLGRCAEEGVATAVVMAGGYAGDVRDTVDIHTATLRVARRTTIRPLAKPPRETRPRQEARGTEVARPASRGGLERVS